MEQGSITVNRVEGGTRDEFLDIAMESNMRLKFLINKAYCQHENRGMVYGNPDPETENRHSKSSNDLLVHVRYIAAEIQDFVGLCARHPIRLSPVNDTQRGIDVCTELYECTWIATAMRDLCKDFVNYPSLTFKEAIPRINAIGLSNILLYARLIATLQEILVGECARKPGSEELGPLVFYPVAYNGMPTYDLGRIEGNREHYVHTLQLMAESQHCIKVLHREFSEYANVRSVDGDGVCNPLGARYGTKYLIAEIDNYIKLCGGLRIGEYPVLFTHRDKFSKLRRIHTPRPHGGEIAPVGSAVWSDEDLFYDISDCVSWIRAMTRWIDDEIYEGDIVHLECASKSELSKVEHRISRLASVHADDDVMSERRGASEKIFKWIEAASD